MANSLPSNTVTATPLATSSTPSCRLAAWMNAIRDLFVNSSNFLSWINTFDALETTSGHVILGYDPRKVPKDIQTKGPNVFVRLGSGFTTNEFSEKTYRDTLEIIAVIVWFHGHKATADFVEELNFICEIIDEVKAKGFTLTTDFGGEVFEVRTEDFVIENPNKRVERIVEFRFSIRKGTGG